MRTLDDALLAFYRLTERFEGIPPTLREFEAEFGTTTSSVAAHWFSNLEEAGLIYTPGALLTEGARGSRTSQLTTDGWSRARALMEQVA